MIFIEGQSYRNRLGEYTVLKIDGDSMHIRYHNGQEVTVSIAKQTTIYENMTRESMPDKRRPTAPRTHRFYQALGFLARRNASLLAFIPDHALSSFKDKFLDATNQELKDNQPGVTIHTPDTDKRWYECRIHFKAQPADLMLFIPLGLTPVVGSINPHDWNINSNSFWFTLLEYGFYPGYQQDLPSIRLHIPQAYIEAFENSLTGE